MPYDIFETRPGRTQEFFRLLREVCLVIVGPSAAIQANFFDLDISKQVVMAAIAIYAEAAITSFVHFIDALRFWHIWKTRHESHTYTRRLRGISLLNFIVPLRETNTGVQIISRSSYFFVAFLAAVLAFFIAAPAIIFSKGDITQPAEKGILSLSLLLLIIIGTGGNLLAGVIFLLERLDVDSFISIQASHVRIIVPVFYTIWLICLSVVLISRGLVYTSSDPSLRALANVYLLPVTTDVAVSTKENGFGQIDVGKMYINLTEYCGVGNVSIDKERAAQEMYLANIVGLS